MSGTSASRPELCAKYPCRFKVDGYYYESVEQYVLAQKALLFNNKQIYDRIMNPNRGDITLKELKNQIENYSIEKWISVLNDTLLKGNLAKFSQNEDLKHNLLKVKYLIDYRAYKNGDEDILNEAEREFLDKSKLKGEKFLGKALLKTKEILKKETLPKIILMMVSSFDGCVKGCFLKNGLIEFFKELKNVPHQAEIYGSKAMKDMYCPGKVDLNKFKDNNNIIPIEDWISPEKLDYYIFTFDRKGDINYEDCILDTFNWMNSKKEIGICNASVVEILLENTPNEYLQFLREKKISYFFAGKEGFDFILALEKMRKIFKVDTAILRGGPTINGVFRNWGLVDEVNVQLLPCSGSEKDSVGIFGKGNIEEYDLIGFKKTEGGSILLNYKKIPYEIKKTISVVCLNEKTALNKNVSLAIEK